MIGFQGMEKQDNNQWLFVGLIIRIMFYQKTLEKDLDKETCNYIKRLASRNNIQGFPQL
jgi:hypothetical protein